MKYPGTQPKELGQRIAACGKSNQLLFPSVFFALLLIWLVTGIGVAHGLQEPGEGEMTLTPVARAEQTMEVTGDSPPLSTKGKPVEGWHDMANMPRDFEGHPVPKSEPQPDVVVKPANRELGKVRAHEVVETSYMVVNRGDRDLIINDVVTSCGCTTATLSHDIIPPGHRADLVVRFDVDFHELEKGKSVVRLVWLLTNDPDTPVAEARLTAMVR